MNSHEMLRGKTHILHHRCKLLFGQGALPLIRRMLSFLALLGADLGGHHMCVSFPVPAPAISNSNLMPFSMR